jgi:DNA-binding NarL/FixJ family response regulator
MGTPNLEPVTYTDRVPAPSLPEPYSRQLTHLEIVVVTLLVSGYDFREIASRRRIRQYRVRDLVRSVCRKLSLRSRYALLCAWECELFHLGLWELQLTPYPTYPLR